jgi:NAD(P)-dependent dehydrogenase (short-subunit alcohol dehydrogenase family)
MGSVVITGGSAGIGRELAFCFARAGWRVGISFSAGIEAAAEAVSTCRSLGAPAAACRLDVCDSASRSMFAEFVRGQAAEVLVHNAGLLIKRPLVIQSTDDIDEQIAVNLLGPINLSRLLPEIPTVVFIGSDIGVNPIPGMAPYCATKAGLRAFASSFAQENPERRVLCLHPDRTQTRMNPGEGRPVQETAEAIFNHIVRDDGPQFEDALLFP